MEHDERYWFGPREQPPQSLSDAQDRVVDAFPLRQALPRWVTILPGPVLIERRAVIGARLDLVEARFDSKGHVATAQCKLGGLLRTPEPRGNSHIDAEALNLRAKLPRLRFPALRQRHVTSGIGVDNTGGVRR